MAEVSRMSAPTILDEVFRLPAEQRLQLVAAFWDSSARVLAEVPVPEWHRELLDARLADPEERATLTWEEVRARALAASRSAQG